MKNPTSYSTTFCRSKMLLTALVFSFCSFTSGIFAQSLDDVIPYGIFTSQDDNLSRVDFDKDANAVIIHHLAKSEYTDSYGMITEHRVKIKVLSERGIDNGDIRIRYYSADDYEDVRNIEGVVKTKGSNGESTTIPLDPKTIYRVKVNKYYTDVRFAMPNIKAGSIFEYRYYVNAENYNLRRWNFQASLPTVLNFYGVNIIPKGEFNYKVYKLREYPIKVDNTQPGYISFRMENIPGLRDEAYMDAEDDNLQHVTFQLSAFNRYGAKLKVVESWPDLSKELMDYPEVGGQLNKSLKGTDDFIKATKLLSNPLDRLKAVHKYVQSKMGWNGYYGIFSDGVKNAWEKGTGALADINLIFIDLLRDADITAIPLLTNDRSDGKIDINFPNMGQFHKLVAYVKLADQTFVIDAADKQTPFQMVPLDLLNTYGYKVDKKDNGLMLIEDNNRFNSNNVHIDALISPEGVLSGEAMIMSTDYARLTRKSDYKRLEKDKFTEKYFTLNYSDLKTDSLQVLNIDNDSISLNQAFVFTQTLNQAAGYIYFDYHLFDGLKKNPFTSDLRFSDINFGSPMRYTVSMTVGLPANFTVDALPKNSSMRTSDTSFQFIRTISNTNGTLTLQTSFDIRRSYFERDEYIMLQQFYKRLFGLLSEQVVLKKKP